MPINIKLNKLYEFLGTKSYVFQILFTLKSIKQPKKGSQLRAFFLKTVILAMFNHTNFSFSFSNEQLSPFT
jgi:hypothetical protein